MSRQDADARSSILQRQIFPPTKQYQTARPLPPSLPPFPPPSPPLSLSLPLSLSCSLPRTRCDAPIALLGVEDQRVVDLSRLYRRSSRPSVRREPQHTGEAGGLNPRRACFVLPVLTKTRAGWGMLLSLCHHAKPVHCPVKAHMLPLRTLSAARCSR